MNKYCIMSFEKIHTMGSLQVRHEHNMRDFHLRHVDASMSLRNEELINTGGLDYKDLWKKRIKEVELKTGKKVKVRKNAVIAYEIVLSFSREAEKEIDVDAWAKKNVEWIKKEFGEDNLISAELHMDETTPHIHAIVVPIDHRNKLCAASFTNGRKAVMDLHSSYAKEMEEFGLERGEMYSRSNKEDLNRFYAQLNKASNLKIPDIKENESPTSYAQRVNKYIQDERIRGFSLEKQAKRQVEVAGSSLDNMYRHYKEAIELQDTIEDNFNGDMDFVRERLRTYTKIEKSVPRKILDGLLKNIVTKFNIKDNFLMNIHRERKQKKFKIGKYKEFTEKYAEPIQSIDPTNVGVSSENGEVHTDR